MFDGWPFSISESVLSFHYRLKMEVPSIELSFKYFLETTNMLEGLIDQVNKVRHCVTPGCNGEYI